MIRKPVSILALLLVVACGACAQRQVILDRTQMGLDAAHKAWVVFDAEKQARINADAKSGEEGEKVLFAWRDQKHTVVLLFAAAYAACGAALIDEDKAIAEVVMLASSVIDALRALGVFNTTPPAAGGVK